MTQPTIVLDFGHGGKDPGAIGNGLQEKDVVLDLGLRVGALLKARGAKVLYTRGIDVFIELGERARMANNWKADFFCSLHINAGGSPDPGTGFESFIHTNINGGATAAYQNIIHRKIATVFGVVGLPDRGQKKKDLAVLRETKMPAIMLEYGFINNSKDATLLKTPGFLDKLAQATAEGIAEAFGLPPIPVSKLEVRLPVVSGLCNVQVNGNPITGGVLIEGRSYVPARALCDALGVNIGWDEGTKTVFINK